MKQSRRKFILSASLATLAASYLRSETKDKPETPRNAQGLSSDEFACIEAIAGLLFPKTEGSPSAKEVGVPNYIQVRASRYLPASERTVIRQGIQLLNTDSLQNTGSGFNDLPSTDQLQVLTQLSKSKDKIRIQFLHIIRREIFVGYFTSQKVGTTVLKHLPIPGSYQGCVELDQANDTCWTFSK